MTPTDTAPLRACGRCAAAKNITGMVILRARARDYLCARHLLPVYDSRIKKILNRPRTDNQWWHDLLHELINDPGLIQELEAVRHRAGAGHMSLLRVFDVMC
jgi:Family of unknown function (DUF6308)